MLRKFVIGLDNIKPRAIKKNEDKLTKSWKQVN